MSLRVDRLPTHILSAILQVISWYLVEYPLLLRKNTVTTNIMSTSETDKFSGLFLECVQG